MACPFSNYDLHLAGKTFINKLLSSVSAVHTWVGCGHLPGHEQLTNTHVLFSIDKRHWHFERKGHLTYFSFYVYCLCGWIQRTRRKAPCSIWAVWELAWWNEQGGTGLHTQFNEKWEESEVHSQIFLLLWWNMLNKWKFIFNLMFCSVATRGVLSTTRGLVWKL